MTGVSAIKQWNTAEMYDRFGASAREKGMAGVGAEPPTDQPLLRLLLGRAGVLRSDLLGSIPVGA